MFCHAELLAQLGHAVGRAMRREGGEHRQDAHRRLVELPGGIAVGGGLRQVDAIIRHRLLSDSRSAPDCPSARARSSAVLEFGKTPAVLTPRRWTIIQSIN